MQAVSLPTVTITAFCENRHSRELPLQTQADSGIRFTSNAFIDSSVRRLRRESSLTKKPRNVARAFRRGFGQSEANQTLRFRSNVSIRCDVQQRGKHSSKTAGS